MSYHISISRNPDKSDEDPIPLEDWERFVLEESRVEPVEVDSDVRGVELDRRCHAVKVKGFENSWLGWSGGTIWTGYPDSAVMKFMLEIAPRFGGVVHGEEGEIFRTPEECEMDLDAPFPKKTFWQRELTKGNIVRMIILVAVAILMCWSCSRIPV